jgi:hypothetical protein
VRQTQGNDTTPDSGTEPFQRKFFSCVETEGASRNGFKLVTSPPLSGLFWRLLAGDGRARDLSTGFLEQVDPREGERLDVVALVVLRSRVRQSPASIQLAALRLRTHCVGELCVLPRAVRRAGRLR